MKRFALLLLLAACSPTPAPPSSQAAPQAAPAPSAPSPQQPSAATGQWRAEIDDAGGYRATSYGPSAGDDSFRVFCGTIVKRVTLQSAHTLPNDQRTTLTIRTATQTLAFPARSENIPDGALVFAQIDGDDPRLAALSARQERFTVEVEGAALVIPWDESIATTLAACR